VRRLAEAGLVTDTGQRTVGGRGRGRVGVYYALADGIGAALAVSIAPAGIVAECIDAYGEVVSRAEEQISRLARPEQAAAALRIAATRARRSAGLTPRLAAVSPADPVDRATGRLIHLPDAPFLVGELDPVQILASHVDGPVSVDNDVNWAARAERDHAGPAALADFAYVFLGEGLGCAIVSDGQVVRGHNGVAGEIAHLITAGPHRQAMPLIEVFGELGLRQAGSTAIDVDRLLAAAVGPQPGVSAIRDLIGQAVSGAIAATVALADPELIIIGGPWGSHPAILDAITACAARLPRHVRVRGAELTDNPSLAGARTDALSRLRADIITRPRPSRR
jgi:predicted NBD/HSP70 family sugar kinase